MPSKDDQASFKRLKIAGNQPSVIPPPKLELPPEMHARFPSLQGYLDKHQEAMNRWATQSLAISIRGG